MPFARRIRLAAASGLTMRHFLDLVPAGAESIRTILNEAMRRKQARGGQFKGAADDDRPLDGCTLAMIFEKSSTRTRVSFEQAIRQLGGTPMMLSSADMQLGRGETIADTARVLSRMVDAIMLRTDAHAKLEELAQHATVPVVNGLTDRSHPCQLLADVMTWEEHRGPVAGTHWVWLGDGNNVAHSLIEIASLLGFSLTLGVPEGYDADANIIADARARGCIITVERDPVRAVSGADAVVTDTWISMGQKYADEKLAAMKAFQVTPALMAHAKPDALFFHCLPAHRGEEVLGEVIDGPQSVVWDEAENRLHVQKAVLLYCFGRIG
jgi:ornithine carbamoyltransferase